MRTEAQLAQEIAVLVVFIDKKETEMYRFSLVVASGLIFCASITGAQTYPSKPIRIMVPSAPGGGTDIVTRLISPKLGESLATQLILDNRAGAGGIVGADIAAKSLPDGYTLLMATGGILNVLPILGKVPYSTKRDFSPITRVAATPNVLLVPLSMSAKSVSELIALAKAKPGALNYASTGPGTGSHLGGELFKSLAHINIVQVPYQGSPQALADLIGGRVDLFFNNALSAMPQVRSGRLRALAVTSPARLPTASEIPTVAESGVPGFEVETWYGLLVPAGTPRTIINRLNAEVVKVIRLPDVQERLGAEGARTIGNTPEQFSAYLTAESTKWTKVLAGTGIRAD